MSAPNRSVEVRLRDARGTLFVTAIKIGAPVDRPAWVLPTQEAVDAEGRRLLRKYVPVDLAARDAGAGARLEAEIGALSRIAHRYAGAHPPELPELVGYQLASLEPFVLFTAPRGTPVAQCATDPLYLQIGLLRAVATAHDVGVVHGRIGLDTLFWTGATVELTDFEYGHVPFEVGDLGDPRDDVRDAAAALRVLTLGGHAAVDLDPGYDPPALKHLLAGAFAPLASERPRARDLLARLQVTLAEPEPSAVEVRLRTLANEYPQRRERRMLAKKAAEPPAVPQRRRPERRRTVPLIVVVLAALIVAALVVALVLSGLV